MIFAPGGSTQPLNRLTYLQVMNVDAVSQERCGVYVSNHVYLCFKVLSAKHILRHDYFLLHLIVANHIARWPHGLMCLCATSNLHRFFTFLHEMCDREAGRHWGSMMEWYSACSEAHMRMHLRSVMRSVENFSRDEHLMTVSAPQAPVHFKEGTKDLFNQSFGC